MNKNYAMLISLLLLFLASTPAESATIPHPSISPTSGYAPVNVTFTVTDTESVTSWLWNFGDGTSSTLYNTSHIYTQPGTYSASVSWCSGSMCGSMSPYVVTVFPTADFSASPTSGDAPLTVEFKDTSTGSPISWTWNFGDGTTSYEQNPVHTYYAAGDYTVILSVRYKSGIEIKSRYIAVNAPNPLVSEFSATPISGKAPLTVEFKDTSTGSPTSWAWDFGDGAFSTEENPTHTYSIAGTYTVNLTVINEKGTNSSLGTINVLELLPPVASFRSNVTEGYTPLTIQFTDLSVDATEWSWDFGDKTYSTEQNPVHTYTKGGKYTVNLTVMNSKGTDSVEKAKYISVSKLNERLK